MHEVPAFVARHIEFFSLLGLALVVNMPDELPYPLRRFNTLAWGYGWLHNTLKTFVSFRSPKQ